MLDKKVREIVEELIQEREDLFLVEVLVKGNPPNQKVLVFIDSDTGLSIDDCSLISRKLGLRLEEMDLLTSKYTLEVSSPGLDFPLMLQRQYKKNIGRELIVELKEETTVTGKLVGVSAEMITLQGQAEPQSIDFQEIKQSKVKISFK